jgi:hypothetical protein
MCSEEADMQQQSGQKPRMMAAALSARVEIFFVILPIMFTAVILAERVMAAALSARVEIFFVILPVMFTAVILAERLFVSCMAFKYACAYKTCEVLRVIVAGCNGASVGLPLW